MAAVSLKPINTRNIEFTIEGISPLVQHKWSEKAKRMMAEKQAGKKTKVREARDPEEECEAATYYDQNGNYGIPVTALKACLINAAHKDIGIEKTLVRKSFFIPCYDSKGVLTMSDHSDPTMREDMVRVGMGSADIRYRPQFDKWSCKVSAEYDADLLTEEDIINLVDRAGFGVGLNEMRPEKGGDFGRFRIDTTSIGGNS